MNSFDHIKSVYFIGIGGIGMSGLAQYFLAEGKRVSGYDKISGRMTDKLQQKGIVVNFEDEVSKIPSDFKDNAQTLIVYTPAVPADLQIFDYFRSNGFALKKRAEVLGAISTQMPTLAVAGTHGKTTTSAILAHLLKSAGVNITAFVGGVCENYGTNFIGDGKEACVVEADEFDRSFLELSPDYAAIISMDADHLDIYESAEQLAASFRDFVAELPGPNRLVFTRGLNLSGSAVAIDDNSTPYTVQNIRIKRGTYQFDFKTPVAVIPDLELHLPGRHNLLNTAVAMALALEFGLDKSYLKPAIKTFKGVERRFSYHLNRPERVLIEDYAHHPEEIKAVAKAVREMYPNEKATVVFQPHLYSRTRDFLAAFAESLEYFDQAFLLPVYPAREQPIPGVDSNHLCRRIKLIDKEVIDKTALPDVLKKKGHRVILMLGAGDIGREVKNVKNALSDEN